MTDKHVDEDWKRQAQTEKEEIAAEELPPIPLDFLGLVSMLATQTLMHLGALPHPETGATSKNLTQAQMTIDILEILEAKTKGNLTKEEEEALRNILSDLRMAFVRSVHEPPPAAKS